MSPSSTASAFSKLSSSRGQQDQQSRTSSSPVSSSLDSGLYSQSDASNGQDDSAGTRPSRRHLAQLKPSSCCAGSSYRTPILRHRPYEEIFAEEAYLHAALQSYTDSMYFLTGTYHVAEKQSVQGESRNVKRQARKQISILRGQIRHASEQERRILVRLGELFAEKKAQETWHATWWFFSVQQSISHHQVSGGQKGWGALRQEKGQLNGAAAEFVPEKSQPGPTTSPRERSRLDQAATRTEDDPTIRTLSVLSLARGNVSSTTEKGKELPRRRLSGHEGRYDDAHFHRRRFSLPYMTSGSRSCGQDEEAR